MSCDACMARCTPGSRAPHGAVQRGASRFPTSARAACRQTVHRARRRVRSDRRRFPADEAARRRLIERFRSALEARDEKTLRELLAPDVTSTADGGGKVHAAPRVLRGVDLVAKVLLGLERGIYRGRARHELASVNGETGSLLLLDGRLHAVTAFETDGERILDMHSQDARAMGETEQRLHVLAAWREAPFYSDRERAALAWTVAVTLVAETHVPDEVWEQVRRHFDEDEIVALTWAIVAINSWNRLTVSTRQPAGTYRSPQGPAASAEAESA